jgi:ammonium transporter, Amt family
MTQTLTLHDASLAICVLFIFLVPFTAAGLALINTGLGRSRSAAHAMLSSVTIMAVAALAYFVFGFAVQGFDGRSAYQFNIHGISWNWIAAEPLFFRGSAWNFSAPSLAVFLQMTSVGIAALIPLGSASERWRMSAAYISTAILASWTYPLFAHWVWGGGWLSQLAAVGIGRGFLDVGGTSTIHVVGGLTALSLAWILGPRKGRYSSESMPAAMPGHNAVYVLFGCFLTLAGWLGLNCSGAILFAGTQLDRLALIGVNTLLSAAAAVLASVAVTRFRFGRPDASLAANAWVGGLVASSAGCAFITPGAAVLIGAVTGAIIPLSVELIELHLATDDPGGAISTHAVAGIWGLLAFGWLANSRMLNSVPGQGNATNSGQFLAQVIGVATLLGFVFPMTFALNWLLNRFYSQRVDPDGERYGMDLHELGAGAYPEFMTHSEDFKLR